MPETVTLKWEEYQELRKAYEELERDSETLREIRYSSGMMVYPDGRKHLLLYGYADKFFKWHRLKVGDSLPFDAVQFVEDVNNPIAIFEKRHE